jgi:hypothetical protein
MPPFTLTTMASISLPALDSLGDRAHHKLTEEDRLAGWHETKSASGQPIFFPPGRSGICHASFQPPTDPDVILAAAARKKEEMNRWRRALSLKKREDIQRMRETELKRMAEAEAEAAAQSKVALASATAELRAAVALYKEAPAVSDDALAGAISDARARGVDETLVSWAELVLDDTKSCRERFPMDIHLTCAEDDASAGACSMLGERLRALGWKVSRSTSASLDAAFSGRRRRKGATAFDRLAVDQARLVVVCITRTYMEAIARRSLHERSVQEFQYAIDARPDMIVPVVLEAFSDESTGFRFPADAAAWHGPLSPLRMQEGLLALDESGVIADAAISELDKILRRKLKPHIVRLHFASPAPSSGSAALVEQILRPSADNDNAPSALPSVPAGKSPAPPSASPLPSSAFVTLLVTLDVPLALVDIGRFRSLVAQRLSVESSRRLQIRLLRRPIPHAAILTNAGVVLSAHLDAGLHLRVQEASPGDEDAFAQSGPPVPGSMLLPPVTHAQLDVSGAGPSPVAHGHEIEGLIRRCWSAWHVREAADVVVEAVEACAGLPDWSSGGVAATADATQLHVRLPQFHALLFEALVERRDVMLKLLDVRTARTLTLPARAGVCKPLKEWLKEYSLMGKDRRVEADAMRLTRAVSDSSLVRLLPGSTHQKGTRALRLKRRGARGAATPLINPLSLPMAPALTRASGRRSHKSGGGGELNSPAAVARRLAQGKLLSDEEMAKLRAISSRERARGSRERLAEGKLISEVDLAQLKARGSREALAQGKLLSQAELAALRGHTGHAQALG